jgi:hypothetical protein
MEPGHRLTADQGYTWPLWDTWKRATLGKEPSLLRY